jgi:Ala-tRNA(Pro) deacylase
MLRRPHPVPRRRAAKSGIYPEGESAMPIPTKIREFLDSHGIAYQFCTHSPAYTAQGLAHVQHVSGKELAKVVMVIVQGHMVMTVLPASHRVEVPQLIRLMNTENCRLATEEEFKDLFPDCEVGAMPPFGNLYNLEVWVENELEKHPTITFNAGTHITTIRMNYSEFKNLVLPKTGSFGVLRQ